MLVVGSNLPIRNVTSASFEPHPHFASSELVIVWWIHVETTQAKVNHMQGMLFHPIVLEIACVSGENGAVMVVLASLLFHDDWYHLITCFHIRSLRVQRYQFSTPPKLESTHLIFVTSKSTGEEPITPEMLVARYQLQVRSCRKRLVPWPCWIVCY